MVTRKSWSWKYRHVSSTVPQTHRYHLLVLAGVSWGLSPRRTPFSCSPWRCFMSINQPSEIHIKTTKCPGTQHMQRHICSIPAHMCDKATTRMCMCVCAEFSPLLSSWASHKRGPLHLSSLKMPVENYHIWFRGGSDVPECMWWTWICLGFPHIHSGVSVPPSLDVGEHYYKLMSTHLWEEWSLPCPFITMDET